MIHMHLQMLASKSLSMVSVMTTSSGRSYSAMQKLGAERSSSQSCAERSNVVSAEMSKRSLPMQYSNKHDAKQF